MADEIRMIVLVGLKRIGYTEALRGIDTSSMPITNTSSDDSDGVPVFDDEPEELRHGPALSGPLGQMSQEELLDYLATINPNRNVYRYAKDRDYMDSAPVEYLGVEAGRAGVGESRFDKGINNPAVLEDIDAYRARQQSNANRILRSVAGMGTLAATTAADTWVGIPAGLANMITSTVAGENSSIGDVISSGIQNPVSVTLQNINERSNEALKVFVPEEQRDRPWYENIFTASFIGDTLIKNAGFTIGAAVGGKVAVGGMAKLVGMKDARNAFKGLAARAGMSEGEALSAIKSGDLALKNANLVAELGKSAKALKDAELSLKLAGSLLAGMGESRIEAINAADEFEKSLHDVFGDLEQERQEAIRQVEEELLVAGVDINSPEGQSYYQDKVSEINERFEKLQEAIQHNKALVANTTFALNLPLLTAGDMIQFGKFMLGDYAVDKQIMNGIRRTANRNALGLRGFELVDSKKKATAKGALNAVRNVLTESHEEMSQSWYSSTAKSKGMNEMTEFIERLYDPTAERDTVSWLNSVKEGFRQSYGNKDDWVEGFAGGFMGFLGLPSISIRNSNQQDSKNKVKVSMNGGIWEPIMESRSRREMQEKIVKTLNDRINSDDFKNYYYGAIGRNSIDHEMNEAVLSGDSSAYDKALHKSFINDAIMFDKAGALDDLRSIIESMENPSDATVEQVYDILGPELYTGVKPEMMKERIRTNAAKMKGWLDDYAKVSEDIKTTFGGITSDEQIEEMTWQTVHIDELEKIMDDIKSLPSINEFLSEYKSGLKPEEGSEPKSDSELLASDGFQDFLDNKMKSRKYSDLNAMKEATSKAKVFKNATSERDRYIDYLTRLSSDPTVVENRQKYLDEKRQKMMRDLQREIIRSEIRNATSYADLAKFINPDGTVDQDKLDLIQEEIGSNEAAAAFSIVMDIHSRMPDAIRLQGEKDHLTEDEIDAAVKAWDYVLRNMRDASTLIDGINDSDIPETVAGKKSIDLMNVVLANMLKRRKDIEKLRVTKPKTESSAPTTGTETSTESTKFKTGKKRLTLDMVVFTSGKRKVKDGGSEETLRTNASNILEINLDKADYYNEKGEKVSGMVYAYSGGNYVFTNSGGRWVAFKANPDGSTTASTPELYTEDGQLITEPIYLSDKRELKDNITWATPIYSAIPSHLEKLKRIVNGTASGKKSAAKTSTASTGSSDEGTKVSPNAFLRPSTDLSMTTREALLKVKTGDVIKFGVKKGDDNIYLLHGSENEVVGVLPSGDDIARFSGLKELIEGIRAEYAKAGEDSVDGIWVSNDFKDTVRETFTGAYVTQNENIPLNAVANKPWNSASGKKSEPIVMFVSGTGAKRTYKFSQTGVSERDIRRASTEPLPAGLLYVLIPDSTGKRFFPAALYNKQITRETFDFNSAADTSTPFGKRLLASVNAVWRAVDNGDAREFERAVSSKSTFYNSLMRLLYFSNATTSVGVYYDDTGTNPDFEKGDALIIKSVDKRDGKTTIKHIKDKKEFIDAIYELHPTVQVNADTFENKDEAQQQVNDLVASDMLLINIGDFDLSMPGFQMDYYVPDGKGGGKFVYPGSASKPASIRKKDVKKGSATKVQGVTVSSSKYGEWIVDLDKVKTGTGGFVEANTGKEYSASSLRSETKLKTIYCAAYVLDKYGDDPEAWPSSIANGNEILLKNIFKSSPKIGLRLEDGGFVLMTAKEVENLEGKIDGDDSLGGTQIKIQLPGEKSTKTYNVIVPDGADWRSAVLTDEDGAEVLSSRAGTEGKKRNAVLAEYLVKTGQAVRVPYNKTKYVVLKDGSYIISANGTVTKGGPASIVKYLPSAGITSRSTNEDASAESKTETTVENVDEDDGTDEGDLMEEPNQEIIAKYQERANSDPAQRIPDNWGEISSNLRKVSSIAEGLNLLERKCPEYKPIIDRIRASKDKKLLTMPVKHGNFKESVHGLAWSYSPVQLRTGNPNGEKYFSGHITLNASSDYRTLMHEIVHAYTVTLISRNDSTRAGIRDIMDYALSQMRKNGDTFMENHPGMKNEKEFVAWFFADQFFQDEMRKIPAMPSERLHSNSLFSQIVRFLAKLFGIEEHYDSLYNQTYDMFLGIISLQSLSSYRFMTESERLTRMNVDINNTRRLLQAGYSAKDIERMSSAEFTRAIHCLGV